MISSFSVMVCNLSLVLAMDTSIPITAATMNFTEHYTVLQQSAASATGELHLFFADNPRALALFAQLNPENADINGGINTNTLLANGILDCQYELRLLAEVLQKPAGWSLPSGLSRDAVLSDWNNNYNQLRYGFTDITWLLDVNLPVTSPHLFALLTAFTTLGDTKSLATTKALYELFSDYGIHLFTTLNLHTNPTLLAANGDADGDKFTNLMEYNAYGPAFQKYKNATDYCVAALDPAIKPGLSPETFDSDHDGLPDVVEDRNHNYLWDIDETDPYSADTDNDGFTDGEEVLIWNTDPLNPASFPELPLNQTAAFMAGLGILFCFHSTQRKNRLFSRKKKAC